ncbi:MAG: hypothetical protein IKH38_00010 [Clostridia bacterium]|nr:hypothetical protein [Clostridia bacterium]
MKLALIGQDIPELLASMLADLCFAHKADAEVWILEKNEAMRELLARYGRAVTDKAGCGRVELSANREEVLRDADCVIYAGDLMASSRFRMDQEALSPPEDAAQEAGLRDQARPLGGIGGLMHTLRQGEVIAELCEEMRGCCPDALVITLGAPVGRTVSLFERGGFRAAGLTRGWRKGPGGLEWIAKKLRVKPEHLEVQAAGVPYFCFFTELRDRRTGRNLLPAVWGMAASGELGRLARRWLDTLEAVPVGNLPEHASLMAAQEDYVPDPNPVLSEPVELRKERILRMNTVGEKGLADPEGQVAQLRLLTRAPSVRPVQLALALLQGRDLEADAVVRRNGRAIVNLPPEAIVEAPLYLKNGVEIPPELTLPGALADCCTEIDEAARLAAQAALGDRTALRECLETDPALDGLDRLYVQDLVDRMIQLHSDILTRWGDDFEEDL